MSKTDEIRALTDKIRKGGAQKYHDSNAAAGKLFCRERIARLCDDGGKDFLEDGLFANAIAGDLPADGVVTGIGTIHGRKVAIMANDQTVKAGSWGARTVKRSCASRKPPGACACRCFIWWTRPARASPTSWTCSRAVATPVASFATRCACRARFPRFACCSGRLRPGGLHPGVL